MSSIENGYQNNVPDAYETDFTPNDESCKDPIPKGFEKTFLADYHMQSSARTLLGRGQFKAVYLLMNESGKKLAQQETAFSKHAATIERTAKTMQSLKLNGTVKIHGVHSENGALHIMTKYYNLGDLEAYAKKLPDHDRLQLLAEACSAVKELNEYGIQHRDIKANNFLVHRKKSGKIKVALSDPDCIQGKVRKNVLMNTLLAPPELLGSPGTHDLWMCGLMTVMTITGKSESDLPWTAAYVRKDKQAVTTLKKELTGFFDGIANPALKAACQKAMHPNSSERGTLQEFISALREAARTA